jgi:osmotically-inducible protein OsmY
MKKTIYVINGFIILGILILNLSYAVSASFTKPDAVITAQLQALIAKDSALSKLPITVSTDASVVKIEGAVSADQAKQLVALAQSVAGVKSVDASALSFKRDQGLSVDDLITSQVMGLYVREGILGPYADPLTHITIQTKGGTVYLTGTVGDNGTANKAAQLAQTIPNVQDVQSSLTVAAP